MNKNLDTITKELGTRYAVKKTAEAELTEKKSEFYRAIDEEVLETETLAQKTIRPSEGAPIDPDQRAKWIKRYHPGWRFVEEDAAENILLEEDPAFKKFVHVNHEDGMFYRRNVSQEGPSLDDERLQTENPTLWKRITKPARVLKDLDTVSDKDLAALQEYFVPGKMTVKLDAPRAAKPEELGDI